MNCAVAKCDRTAEHRGWCSMHYQRWLHHGDPTITLKHGPPTGRPTKHGQCINGNPSRTYRSWQQMRERCHNKRHVAWKLYGSRGISICASWDESFNAFLKDMGECPPGLTLERIDRNGDYEPTNCKWATRREQARNTSRNVLTLEKAKAIRALRSQGFRARVIGELLGLGEPTVRGVINGYTWREE